MTEKTKSYIYTISNLLSIQIRSYELLASLLSKEYTLTNKQSKEIIKKEEEEININASFYKEIFSKKIIQTGDKIYDSKRNYNKSNLVTQWGDEVTKASKKYGIPKNVLYAIIHQESAGKNQARANRSSATGLMQITKPTASALGLKVGYDKDGNWIDERLDADKNIDAGARYLSQHLKRFNGDISMAIMAYHQGAGAASGIQKSALRGDFMAARQPLLRWNSEGLKYVPSVFRYTKIYEDS